MPDLPRIEDLPSDGVYSAALEVGACISEAFELTSVHRHYAALASEANAGRADADPAYARMACVVAGKLREDEA
ncbi:MAG: hypothetical protein ACU0B9_19445 [Limimaricola soesokkakensis]|uniref:hypothetical protein n=1 Tax=Limimaricola soesokkakensis TaxID=1343159 RepID=UPI0040591193